MLHAEAPPTQRRQVGDRVRLVLPPPLGRRSLGPPPLVLPVPLVRLGPPPVLLGRPGQGFPDPRIGGQFPVQPGRLLDALVEPGLRLEPPDGGRGSPRPGPTR